MTDVLSVFHSGRGRPGMMRKPEPRQFVGGMLLLLAATLSALGCTAVPRPCAECPLKGGTLIDAISQEPSSLLPQRSTQQVSLLVGAAVRTPLFATDDKGGIVPALATELP